METNLNENTLPLENVIRELKLREEINEQLRKINQLQKDLIYRNSQFIKAGEMIQQQNKIIKSLIKTIEVQKDSMFKLMNLNGCTFV